MTWLEYLLKYRLQIRRRFLTGVLLGTYRRAVATQFGKFGGLSGTSTGAPFCCASNFATTTIQCLNAWSVIGLPATEATELPGIPLPQPVRLAASTKKAP